MPFLLILFAVVAVEAVAFAIMPRPAAPKDPAVQDLQAPTADASREKPVIFGELTVAGTNVLWVGDKDKHTYKVSA